MNSKTSLLILIALAGSACTSPRGYLERGKKAFDAGKYEDASLNFRKAIQKDKDLGEAYYRLALAELQQKKTESAFLTLRRAVELMPENDEAGLALANLCVQSYESDPSHPRVLYDQLVKSVTQMEARSPNGYDTLRLKGYLASIDRKLPESILFLGKANQVKPLQAEVVVPLVQALIQDQRFPEAEKLAQAMIQKDKAYGPIYDVLYSAHMAANRPEQAEAVLKTKVANNPTQASYALQLASHYARLKKSSEASAIVKGLLDHPNDFPRIYLLTGNFYAGIGNWEEATRLYEEGAKHDPIDKVLYQKKLSSVLLLQDKKEDAARLLDAILQEAPKDAEAEQLRALLLLDSHEPGKVEKAVTELGSLSKQTPSDLMIRYQLSRAYIAKGDLAAAHQELSEILRLNSGFWPAHLLLADVAFQRRQPGQMLPHASAVLAVQPGNRKARLFEAMALMGLGNSAQARGKLGSLLKDQPQYAEAEQELGFFDLAEGKNQQAEDIFRKFYQPGRTSPRALEGLVRALRARGRSDEALRLLEAEVNKSPQPGPLRILLAQTAAQAGRDDLAIEQLQQTVKETPGSYVGYFLLAQVYSKKGDLSQAIAALEKAREVSPNTAEPIVLLASLQDRAGRKEALTSYRRALQLQPDNPALMNAVAYYLAENGGDLDEALTMAQRAVQKLNNDPNSADTLGWIYLKKNMTDAALRIFSGLVKKNPNNAVFRHHLGAALAARGDNVAARSELSAALLKNPSKPEEAKIKSLLAQLR